MRVALFGGSFNPPHVAHQLVMLYVLETQPVDELWMIPCFQHPFEKSLEPFADRLAMCKRAAQALGSRVKVSEIERELGGESRTLRTVQALKAAWPATEFSLVIGSDLEAETDSWYGADELRRIISFLVVGRGGYPGAAPLVMPAISSSDVRMRLQAQGQDGDPRAVQDLVPRDVLDYIRERGLYGSLRKP